MICVTAVIIGAYRVHRKSSPKVFFHRNEVMSPLMQYYAIAYTVIDRDSCTKLVVFEVGQFTQTKPYCYGIENVGVLMQN